MRNRQVTAAVMVAMLTCAGRLAGPSSAVAAQNAAAVPARSPQQAAAAAEVVMLDQTIGSAVVRGDTAYVDSMTADDFVMVHGDGWTNGGKPLQTDTKASMLRRVTTRYYDVLDFDAVKVEMHGDVAITYGRYIAHTTGAGAADRAWFAVWYERVYARRDGKWTYLSHRTVHGPTFGSDRQSVSQK